MYSNEYKNPKKTYDAPESSERKRRDTNGGSGDVTAHLQVSSVSEAECLAKNYCLRPVSFI